MEAYTMNALYHDIGNRIATLRRENGLTQIQLAEYLDISVKHCSECERGLSCLSLEKLLVLCDVLSTDLDYLIRGIDKRNKSESNIPTYILEFFTSSDEGQKQLFKEYFLFFKKMLRNKDFSRK